MKKLVLLGFLLGLSAAATAQEISYEYIEGLYAQSDYEEGGVWGESLDEADGEGGFINLSLLPTEKIYTKFGLGYHTVDDTAIDIASFTVAVGTHWEVADCVELYLGGVGAAGRASDLKFPPPNVADNRDDVDGYGLGAEIGVRGKMGEHFELEANGTYINLFGGDVDDVSEDSDDFTATVSARFYPVPQFSIGAGYSYAFGNEIETFTLGVRYDFCCF